MDTKLSKNITEQLELGSKVYLNLNSQNILAIPDFTQFDENYDLWKDELMELKKNRKNWTEITKWNSEEEFEFMKDFVKNEVTNENLQNELTNALQNSKPFHNFKLLVENNEKCRQKWFDFIAKKHQTFIEKLLETLNY